MVLSRFPSILPYMNRNVLAIFFLGIASGLPLALVYSTLSIWLTESGVTRTAIGLFALVSTPYALKFLWSPLIDQMPLPFLTRLLGRRRGWLILTQVCLALSIFAMGMSNPADNAFYTALFAFLVAISSASQDIVIDAYRVEILTEEQQPYGAATVVFGYRVGMLLSGAGALYLADYFGWFITYSVMALLVGIGIVTTLVNGEPAVKIKEEKLKKGTGNLEKARQWIVNAVINPFADFMKRSGWLTILLFIVLYKLGDAFAGIMTNPFLVELGFSKSEIASIVKIFGFIAVMVGSFIGGIMVNKLGIIKSLWICGILQLLSNFVFVAQAYLGYSIEMLCVTIAVENLSGSMGTIPFVAYISSLCNVRYTATQYALFSSLAAVGRTWISASSGFVVDQLGWVSFFISSAAIAIPGLLVLIILERQQKKLKN